MIAQPATQIRIILLLITVLGLAACGTNAPAQHPVASRPAPQYPVAQRPAKRESTGEQAAAIAIEQIGAPYRYGGSSPNGFDCSGLVHFSYRGAGVAVPRTTGQLWSAAETVSHDELRAGDLLFFSIEGKMSHVGMYVGEKRFVHAPQSGRSVSLGSLESPFYKSALIRAGRVY